MFVGVVLIDKNRNVLALDITGGIKPDVVTFKNMNLTRIGVLPLGNDLIGMSVIVSNSGVFHDCIKGRGYEGAVFPQILLLFFLEVRKEKYSPANQCESAAKETYEQRSEPERKETVDLGVVGIGFLIKDLNDFTLGKGGRV